MEKGRPFKCALSLRADAATFCCLQRKFFHSCQRMKSKSCDRRRREKLQHCVVIRNPDYWMPPMTILTRMMSPGMLIRLAPAAAGNNNNNRIAKTATAAMKRIRMRSSSSRTTRSRSIARMSLIMRRCGRSSRMRRTLGECLLTKVLLDYWCLLSLSITHTLSLSFLHFIICYISMHRHTHTTQSVMAHSTIVIIDRKCTHTHTD